jgi:hypothetical protein
MISGFIVIYFLPHVITNDVEWIFQIYGLIRF